MRIEIDPQTADAPDSLNYLDRILTKFEDGWHVWDTGQMDIEAMCSTTWINDAGRQGDRGRSILYASIRRDAWTSEPHGRLMRVTAAPSAPDELKPEDACRLAEEPLCILVENRISDGAFVERVVKELDDSLGALWDRPGDPIRIDSVGGKGQMPQEVERRTRGRPYRPRLVAIVDSDRKAPGDAPSADANRLNLACSRKNLPCWILAKRETENYLPSVLLRNRRNAGADHAQRVAAWDRLTDDQKNFIDMRNGLPAILSPAEQRLFGELSAADREILSHGFGPTIGECWKIRNVPARQELRIRGQDDLELGINMIRSEV